MREESYDLKKTKQKKTVVEGLYEKYYEIWDLKLATEELQLIWKRIIDVDLDGLWGIKGPWCGERWRCD